MWLTRILEITTHPEAGGGQDHLEKEILLHKQHNNLGHNKLPFTSLHRAHVRGRDLCSDDYPHGVKAHITSTESNN